jgi:hypothetical protein
VSEYQSYEFIALDRPLTTAEMSELRAVSTRAGITPTRFWNEYHWGDLRADPAKLLARYFDMHLYFANWGTRRLMLRLPSTTVDVTALRPYFPDDAGAGALTTSGKHVILDLVSEVDEPEDDWFEAGRLAALLAPVRAGLLGGDLRAAYLAWPLAVRAGEVEPGGLEPPLPRGIGQLPAPLAALAEFLRIDQDLLAAAAEAATNEGEDPGRFREWVRRLPARERDRWLLRAADNPSLALRAELLGAFHRAHPPVTGGQRPTAARLLERAEQLEGQRRR